MFAKTTHNAVCSEKLEVHGACKTAKRHATETSNACKTQPPTHLLNPLQKIPVYPVA